MARPLRYLPPDCPLVEVTCRTVHGRLLEAMYRSYRDAYRDASELLRQHRAPVRFPSHGIPPPVASAAAG